MLTKAELNSYHEDGFLAFPGIFTEAEVEAMRAALETPEIIGAIDPAQLATTTVHQLDLTWKSTLFAGIARDPRLVDRLRPLLGDDIQLQHSKLAIKGPTKGVAPFNWHQDFAFFPHTNTSLAAVMVVLDDTDEGNGCLQMVRGSHRFGLLNHRQDGWFIARCVESQYWQPPHEIVNLVLPAGSISIHHCLALHGSQANQSGANRRTVVFQYRADDAYQLASSVWKDSGVMINGRRRERVRCEPGVWRLPKWHANENKFGAAWHQDGEMALAERDFTIDPDAAP